MAGKKFTLGLDDVMEKANKVRTNDYEPVVNKEKPKPSTQTINLTYGGNTVTVDLDGSLVNGFFLGSKQIKIAQYITHVINNNAIGNVLALGDAGTGKTTFVKSVADALGIPYYYINCAVFRDPTEWFGQMVVRNNETFFEYSPLAEFIMNGNGIVILDELNRTDEFTRGVLLSMLDTTRKITIQKHDIKVGNSLVFYATANQGFGYTGTHTFDLAEFRRFVYVKFEQLDYTTQVEALVKMGVKKSIAETIIGTMDKIYNKLKSNDSLHEVNFKFNISKSIQVAELVLSGLSVKDAFVFAVLDGVNDDMNIAIQSIINGNY